jgi:hypothetical protein
MNLKSYTCKTLNARVKTLMMAILTMAYFGAGAQYYSFSKSSETYTELTGATVLVGGNWDDFSVKIKTPFNFKFFSKFIFDSIEFTDLGDVYFNNINNGLFQVYWVDLNSRGNNKSDVSYKTEGTSPNRILKLQFHNAGFDADAPTFADSVNFQLWVHETSNVLEFRYGPNGVNTASYGGDIGPYVTVADPDGISGNFISLEGSPSNPTVRTTNQSSSMALTGSPTNGTLYRFTPSIWKTGLSNITADPISIRNNELYVPVSVKVDRVTVTNMSGQVVQVSTDPAMIRFDGYARGIYFVTLNTKEGVLRQKLVL